MTEPFIEDYKLHLILLNEWKSRSTIDEATKIANKRLDGSLITSTKVQYWFKRFEKGDNLIFGKKSPLNISIQNSSCDPFNSLLFLTNEEYDSFWIHKCDSRSIEYTYWFKNQWFFIQHDLFLNEKRQIKSPFDMLIFETINSEFSLAFNKLRDLCLIKLDYENSTIIQLDSIDLDEDDYSVREIDFIAVDQLNPKNFILFMDDDNKFVKGKIDGEKIVLGEFKTYDDDIDFISRRLLDNKLQWFEYHHEEESIEFCEWNLETDESHEVDVSMENDSLIIGEFEPQTYCWSKNRFYGMFEMEDDDKYCILMFNLDELKWMDIRIVANEPRDMFIDSNEVLTLKVGKDKEVNAFYRLNLRRPDSLKNLAHLTALRQSSLFEDDKYLNYVKRFSIRL